ncbi:MAG: ATP-binding protein [Bacteroidales bacterium]|nr:ATP-binding protein [Bacteroidales bacterium]
MITKSDIQDVIVQQMNMISSVESYPREQLKEIKIPYRGYAYIISGIRRCGKSTLVGQLLRFGMDTSLYVKFDTPRLYGFSMEHFRLLDSIIAEKKPQHLFFDEIQVVEGWEVYVLGKLDEGYNVVVTGSNATMLSRELGTRLTGRHIAKSLYPFSYNEYVGYRNKEHGVDSLCDYLADGGFPAYLIHRDEEVLAQLTEDVLYRDIMVRYGIKESMPLKKLASYLASNCARLTSANNLKDIIGVKSPQTVLDYFSYLSDAYLFQFVSKFSYSYRSQQLNPKKVYCIDTGLQSVLTTSFSQDAGRRLENMVYLELLRRGGDIYYYAERKGECDFIVSRKNKVDEAMQVCLEMDDENRSREVGGLLLAMEAFELQKGTILTLNQKDTLIENGRQIDLIPVWQWCREKSRMQ